MKENHRKEEQEEIEENERLGEYNYFCEVEKFIKHMANKLIMNYLSHTEKLWNVESIGN